MNVRAMERFGLGAPNNALVIGTTGTTQLRLDQLSNRPVVLNVAAGCTISFPRTTGSGVIFYVVVLKVSTVGYILQTDPTTDAFFGSLSINLTGSTSTPFASGSVAANCNVITLNGTTTGGAQIGDTLQFIDVAVGTWAVSGDIIGTGTVATPFS
jgi:hypothetical protein